MNNSIKTENPVNLLRLDILKIQKEFDSISTNEEKQELDEISSSCEEFLKRKGSFK